MHEESFSFVPAPTPLELGSALIILCERLTAVSQVVKIRLQTFWPTSKDVSCNLSTDSGRATKKDSHQNFLQARMYTREHYMIT